MFSTLHFYGIYFSFVIYFKMLSAIHFNLDPFKILLSGNGLCKNSDFKVLFHFDIFTLEREVEKQNGGKKMVSSINFLFPLYFLTLCREVFNFRNNKFIYCKCFPTFFHIIFSSFPKAKFICELYIYIICGLHMTRHRFWDKELKDRLMAMNS